MFSYPDTSGLLTPLFDRVGEGVGMVETLGSFSEEVASLSARELKSALWYAMSLASDWVWVAIAIWVVAAIAAMGFALIAAFCVNLYKFTRSLWNRAPDCIDAGVGAVWTVLTFPYTALTFPFYHAHGMYWESTRVVPVKVRFGKLPSKGTTLPTVGKSLEMANRLHPAEQTVRPKGVALVLGLDEVLVGTGFVIYDPKKSGFDFPMFATAFHVFRDANKGSGTLTVCVGTKGVELPIPRVGLRYNKVMDYIYIPVSHSFLATMGIKALKLGEYSNSSIVSVYSPPDEEDLHWKVSRGMPRSKRAFQILYPASTAPGSSGSPVMQGGRVIGIHLAGNFKNGVVENEGVLWVPLDGKRTLEDTASEYASRERDRKRVQEMEENEDPGDHMEGLDRIQRAEDVYHMENGMVETSVSTRGSSFMYTTTFKGLSWAEDANAYDELTQEEYEERHIGLVAARAAMDDTQRLPEATTAPDFPAGQAHPKPVPALGNRTRGLDAQVRVVKYGSPSQDMPQRQIETALPQTDYHTLLQAVAALSAEVKALKAVRVLESGTGSQAEKSSPQGGTDVGLEPSTSTQSADQPKRKGKKQTKSTPTDLVLEVGIVASDPSSTPSPISG